MNISPVEIIIAVVVAAFFASWFILQIVKGVRSKRAGLQRVEAVLVFKHEEDYMTKQVFVGRSPGELVQDGVPEKRRLYVLEFREDNQQTHTFEVEDRVYEDAVEGARDILIFRGEEFLSFGSLRK